MIELILGNIVYSSQNLTTLHIIKHHSVYKI
jgi:hypothetical protein